jgi:putative zinc finger/helix-turn-helix YgiT family protein
MEHDGRPYTIRIPDLELLECDSCKTRMLTDESRKRLTYALRKEAGLLLPEEIRERRLALKLGQEQLAKSLKVAKETVSRWETGNQIQQRAMDLLLRLFFDLSEVRSYLARRSESVTSATTVITVHMSAIVSNPPYGEYKLWAGKPLVSDLPVGN